MSEPEWYARALAEGRILADTGVARVPTDSTPPPAEAVELPLCPCVNNLFINLPKKGKGRGGRVKSPEYRAWVEAAAPLARRIPPPDPPPSLAAPVRVVVTVWGRKGFRRSRDIANHEKPVVDILVREGVIPGDSIMDGVWESLQRYRPDPRRPGPPVVTVHFERVDPGEG